MSEEIELPLLIILEDFGGDWDTYIEAVYQIFKRDFLDEKLSFNGKPIRLKRLPIFQNRESTFYHITHQGKDEQNRIPDLSRCERIEWIRIIIENCEKWDLKTWKQVRDKAIRICIWLEMIGGDDVIVILDERPDCYMLWTVFTLKYGHEKRKKQKEYEEYIKNNP